MTEDNGEHSDRDERDERGRFLPGNRGGPGCPFGKRAELFRSAIMRTVTEADMEAIVGKLIAQAKAGDIRATALLFDRVLGRVPDAPDIVDRLSQLEVALGLEA